MRVYREYGNFEALHTLEDAQRGAHRHRVSYRQALLAVAEPKAGPTRVAKPEVVYLDP
jgi:hypothetical protein